MNKILITGAAGFIGSQLAHALWQKGEQVTLLDNFSYGLEDNLIFEDYDFRQEILREDVCDRPMLDKLFETKQFDYVYHIAAITPLPDCQVDPGKAVEVNVAGTVNILEAARKYGAKKMIFASTSAVYENCTQFPTVEDDVEHTTLVYSTCKYAAEQFCRAFSEAYGLPVTVLRFANVYGPHIDCLRTQPPVAGYIIRELYYGRRPVMHSTGEQRRDFVYVEDLIDLAIRVQQGGGYDVINVSTNQTYSINQIYETIARIMGREDILPERADSSHYWYRYPALYEGAYQISEEILDNEVNKHTECSNTLAKGKYGWDPQTSLEDGLRATVEFSIRVLERAATPKGYLIS